MAVVAASNNHVLIFSPNSYEWPPLNEQYSRSMPQETILARGVDCDNSNSQRCQAVLSFQTYISSQVEPRKSCSVHFRDDTQDVGADTEITSTGSSICEPNSTSRVEGHSQSIAIFNDLASESTAAASFNRLASPECSSDTPDYLDDVSVLHNSDDLKTNSHVPEQNNEVTAGDTCSEQNNEVTAGNTCSEQNNEVTVGDTCSEQNSEENAVDTCSEQNSEENAVDTCSEQNSEENAEDTCRKKKKPKKVRRKTIKKWKPCSNAELGFHISVASFFKDNTANLEKDSADQTSSEGDEDSSEGNNDCSEGNIDSYEDNETRCEGNGDPCKGDTCQTELAEVNSCEASSSGSAQDDVNFFLNLGIDVVNYDSQDDVQDWDGVHLSVPSEYTSCNVLDNKKSSRLKTKPAKRINCQTNTSQKSTSKTNRVSQSETLHKTFQLSDFGFSKIKKSDKYKLFELECSSTKRIYIRRDRHRKKEKIHKAVKSKNCRSVFSNNSRKRMYMHHRLIKMHNLNLNFRESVKSYRIPAMPKSKVAVDVAKVVFRADRKAQTRDAVPPVQSLNHALHETNCAVGIERDLANFLISLQHRDLTPEDYDMLLQLDDSLKPKTVSKNILQRLRTEQIGPNGPEQGAGDWEPLCTICMEPYVSGQERKFLPCNHDFHTECIDKWLKNSSMNCPLDGLPVEAS